MPWTIQRTDDHPRILEVSYIGLITPAELNDCIGQAIATGRTHALSRVLTDCTRMTGGHTLVDLYAAVELMIARGLAGTFVEAILLPSLPESEERVQFWETACHNRGIRVRLFADRAAAVAWLESV